MVRSQCCEKISVKRGVWSAEEDAKILAFVSKHGSGNWTSVPKKAGLKRCGKSCRLRWTNYLRPDLKHDNFTPQEEDLIIKLHAAIGSRWSIIAQQLPGRTDNDVKNYWNTKLKKKLSQMGIDPVTHKPFSKLIADYGNIGGGCQKQSTSRIGGSVNKDLKNAMMLKSETYQTLPQELIRSINNNQTKQSPNTSAPKMEPNENNFLFNRSHDDNNNPSMDFAQIQAMPIIATSASNCIDIDIAMSTTSSPSSSSSNCSTTTAQETLPLSFSWNDFLLDDAFAPPTLGDNHEQDMVGGFMSKDLLVSHMEHVTRQSLNKKEVKSSSSSSEISFVEAMLDQENEMFLSFPHLMEEPPNY